jgi:hypothetical protein
MSRSGDHRGIQVLEELVEPQANSVARGRGSYQRVINRDEDSRRDRNKDVDKATCTATLVTSINASTKSPTRPRFGDEKVKSIMANRRQLLLNGQ